MDFNVHVVTNAMEILTYEICCPDLWCVVLSSKCRSLYKKRTGKEIDDYTDEWRYDPALIKIYKERGSYWCCDGDFIKLKLNKIPLCFKDYHQIKKKYTGGEYVYLNKHHAISDYALEYLKDPNPESLNMFKQKVAEIMSLV